jgi:membrane-associated phospholipid phosphatase
MQQQGLFLKQPRYSLFAAIWVLLIFVISILLAHLYAWSRATLGAGPKTAVKIGMIVGFCAGFPGNFAQATWSPIPRVMPLGWMLDIWIGSIIATVIAGALYDSPPAWIRHPNSRTITAFGSRWQDFSQRVQAIPPQCPATDRIFCHLRSGRLR